MQNLLYFQLGDLNLSPPKRSTSGSAGLDLFIPQSIKLAPGEIKVVDHKIKFIFPLHHFGLLVARSSAAASGLCVTGGVIGIGLGEFK